MHPVGDVSDTELIAAAAAVEARSEHPLARAVRAAATDAGVTVRDTGEFTALPGAGAWAVVDGRDVLVGSPALLREQDVDIDAVRAAGYDPTTIVVVINTMTLTAVTPRDASAVGLGDPIIDVTP